MQRCKISYFIPGKIEFRLSEGEEETAEDLIDRLSAGNAPTWLETLIKRGLNLEQIEIESADILGLDPGDGEELDFEIY